MPSGRPWYQRNPADFIMAVRGWDLELVGAYSLIIDHLNDRDRPLPNDDKFMAGLLHCSPQRWRKLRDALIRQGKLYVTDDDYLSNPRFDREHAGRFRTRAEAVQTGRAGGFVSAAKRAGQTELNLDPDSPPSARAHDTRVRSEPESGKELAKIGQNFSNSSARSLSASETKTKQNQRSAARPPSSPVRARQSPELREEEDSTQPSGSTPCAGAREGPDLKTLYDEVCEAAGFSPTQPSAIDRAMTRVEQWRDLGCDFDRVVLPAIRAVVLSTDEPTRTLGRFNARVLHEQAKRVAALKKGEPYVPPEVPHLNPEGEDPQFFALRTELLDRLGPTVYAPAFNHVKFEDVPDGPKGRTLRLVGPDYLVDRLRHSTDWSRILKATARVMDFVEVW